MDWIIEPMAGFDSLVGMSAEAECTGGAQLRSCSCTGGLLVCDCSGGLKQATVAAA